jgi:CxxC-x17-CxxC domain-containing protein
LTNFKIGYIIIVVLKGEREKKGSNLRRKGENMADNISDLEGKSPDELDRIAREEQTRLDKLLRTREPDFGLSGPETKPITDDEVKAAIEDLEKAIKIRNIAYLQARQRAVLEGIQRRAASELAQATRISLYGLREEAPSRERRGPARTEQRPLYRQRQPRRQMFAVDETCADCGAKVTELPFRPAPGQTIYCSNCFEARRGQKGQTGNTMGAAFQDALQEKERRIRELEEENAALRAGGSVASPKLSKKERKRLAKLKRGELEEE